MFLPLPVQMHTDFMFKKNDFENLKKLESILIFIKIFYKNIMPKQRIPPSAQPLRF